MFFITMMINSILNFHNQNLLLIFGIHYFICPLKKIQVDLILPFIMLGDFLFGIITELFTTVAIVHIFPLSTSNEAVLNPITLDGLSDAHK